MAVNEGGELEIDFDTGAIRDLTTSQTFQAKPFPDFIKKIIAADGLVGYITQKK